MAEVNLNDISSNSDSARNRTEPLVEETTDIVKHAPLEKVSIFKKLFDFFGINTELEGAGSAIWNDVIVPAFLDGCRDSVYAAADYIFGGASVSRKNSQGKKRSKSGYTNYSAQSTKPHSNKQPNVNSYHIEFDERVTNDPDNPGAQDVLNRMNDVLDVSGNVTVQDMITLAGKSTTNYTLGDWGWTDLSRVMVRTTPNRKYKIDLPKPVYLKED